MNIKRANVEPCFSNKSVGVVPLPTLFICISHDDLVHDLLLTMHKVVLLRYPPQNLFATVMMTSSSTIVTDEEEKAIG